MSIGGDDYVLPLPRPLKSSLEIAARTVRGHWPKALFVALDVEGYPDGKVFRALGEVPFHSLRELFIYRDSDSFVHECIEDEIAPLVYLINRDQDFTVVLEHGAGLEPIKDDILTAVKSALLGGFD